MNECNGGSRSRIDLLPVGWVQTTLNEIVYLNPRWLSLEPDDADVISFVPMACVEAGTGRMDASQTRHWKQVKNGYTRFQEGDVIFAKITPCMENGKCAVATNLIGGYAAGSTEFHVLRPTQAILAKLLVYYLLQESVRRDARKEMTGTAGQLRVRPSFFEGRTFWLPPLSEQHRIVAEIEKQFTRLDAAVAALKRVQANLKRYRASVLKAACEGRLVPTEAELARAEGRDYESAEQLLARILKERRARWEADQLAKLQAQGKKPKDDGWKQKYQEPAGPDMNNLPRLPEGWIWCSIGQAFEVFVGATPSRTRKEYWGGNIHWVSSGEVAFCYIRDTREKITQLGLENTSTEVHPPGTVLIGMIGEGRTRGQVAILKISACNNQNSAAIRVSEAGLPADYLYRYLEGVYEQTRRLGSGNNQPALNKSRVQAMIFPLPPLAEQQRIVAEVERRLSVIDEIESVVAANLKRAERLRQAILKRAFEGKLVPQDPNDEPASVLLERIRAERTQPDTKGKTKKPARRQGRKATGNAQQLFSADQLFEL